MLLPAVYPIIDIASFVSAHDPVEAAVKFTSELLRAGTTLVQYRDKSGNARRMLSCARELRRITQGKALLMINDRVDLCLAVDADGVHLGQDDLSPEAARRVFDSVKLDSVKAPNPQFLVGFSTHNPEQVAEADRMPVDYIAVGPVFSTSSKDKPDPVIGIEGVRRARRATRKPLVAIGGITRVNCRQIRDAGADSVAVISDLLGSPAKALEEFVRILE